tara:strand:+ start:2058 stop:2162 length:105 start_codon:yes stop_codon:yes gene_type:complete
MKVVGAASIGKPYKGLKPNDRRKFKQKGVNKNGK